MNSRSLKSLFLLMVLVVSTIGQGFDFTSGCVSAAKDAAVLDSKGDDESCAGTATQVCHMKCPKDNCCCGHQTPSPLMSLFFANPTCNDGNVKLGGVILPAIFGWRFITSEVAYAPAAPEALALVSADYEAHSSDFVTSPATPPPRAA